MAPSDKRMIVLHGLAIVGSQPKPIAILVDTGCTVSCMPEGTARKLGLPFRRTRHNKVAILADGSERPMNYEAILTLRLGPSYTCNLKIDLSAGTLAPKDMLLGMDWLCTVNPKINFRPLSLKITDKNGRTWEIVGMRPPGQPHFCRNHGYRCRGDKFGGGIPDGMRNGGGGFGRRMPHGGFGQAIPIFKQETKERTWLPCTCDVPPDGKKEWVDWRDLFADRERYAEINQKKAEGVSATEKSRLLEDATNTKTPGRAKDKACRNNEQFKPRRTRDTKGTVERRKRSENYDLIR